MAPDRVLVASTFGGGGIHQYTDEQCERLPESVDVETHDMFTPDPGEGVVWLLATVVRTVGAVLAFLGRSPPDVVHVHTSHRYSFYRSSVYVLLASHVWGRPVVLHVHGSSFDEFVRTDHALVDALQSAVFDASDEIIVLSAYWRDVLAAETDPAKIRVVPNAVDPSTFPVGDERADRATAGGSADGPESDGRAVDGRESDGREGDGPEPDGTDDGGRTNAAGDGAVPHVVFVSNLIERKGVRELAAALEALSAKRPGEFRATVAGDGPLADRVERLAAACEEVTYVGYVSEARKRSLLAEGSIFVLPTYAEGLPIAMLEGMAGENAVVATSVGAIPEVVGDDRGVLVEPGDVDALTDALETLVTSPGRRTEMAANNRRAVEAEYAWDAVVDELVGVYDAHA